MLIRSKPEFKISFINVSKQPDADIKKLLKQQLEKKYLLLYVSKKVENINTSAINRNNILLDILQISGTIPDVIFVLQRRRKKHDTRYIKNGSIIETTTIK